MTANKQGIALWTRVWLCRNLEGCRFVNDDSAQGVDNPPFSVTAKTTESAVKTRRVVYKKIDAVIQELALQRRIKLKGLTGISVCKLIEYYERGLLSSYMKIHQNDKFRGLITGAGSSVIALVNEKHHLILQDLRQGFKPERAWQEVNALDDLFSSKLKFAWDKNFGYLGPDAECSGTGLRMTVALHLPALAHLGELSPVSEAFGAMNMMMEAELSDDMLVAGFGQVLRISNSMTGLESEEAILHKVKIAVTDLIFQESQARLRILHNPVVKRALFNKIACSLAILKNAFLVSRADLSEFISWVRLGVMMGLIKGLTVVQLDKLHRELWSSNFLYRFKGNAAEALEHVSCTRANVLRERLSHVKVSF